MPETPRRGRGRPEELTPDVQRRFVEAVRAGNHLDVSASYAGKSKDTIYRWLRRGAREATGPYRDFSDAVQRAQAEAEVRDVALIGRAAEKQWQAAAWRLERRAPQRWARRDRVSLEGPKDGSPVDVRVRMWQPLRDPREEDPGG